MRRISISVSLVSVLIMTCILRHPVEGYANVLSQARPKKARPKPKLELLDFYCMTEIVANRPNTFYFLAKAEVKNNTDKVVTGIELEINFYNSKNQVIADLKPFASKGIKDVLRILPGEAKELEIMIKDERAYAQIALEVGRYKIAETDAGRITRYTTEDYDPSFHIRTPKKVELLVR
jgi:hypothetical protein